MSLVVIHTHLKLESNGTPVCGVVAHPSTSCDKIHVDKVQVVLPSLRTIRLFNVYIGLGTSLAFFERFSGSLRTLLST